MTETAPSEAQTPLQREPQRASAVGEAALQDTDIAGVEGAYSPALERFNAYLLVRNAGSVSELPPEGNTLVMGTVAGFVRQEAVELAHELPAERQPRPVTVNPHILARHTRAFYADVAQRGRSARQEYGAHHRASAEHPAIVRQFPEVYVAQRIEAAMYRAQEPAANVLADLISLYGHSIKSMLQISKSLGKRTVK
jgi:hypothetical protein